MKTALLFSFIFVALGLLCVGHLARAAAGLQITEVMYDLSGTDEGREWIEVTNNGSEPIDISKYKLFENETNHGLALVSGSKALQPGASAVVASDAKKFLIDWPRYTGALFDSAFALSNTGESVSIKNASSSVLDTATYTESMGAAGDGASLHKQGNSFVPAIPNPGIYPGELVAISKPVVTQKSTPVKVAAPKAKAQTPVSKATSGAVQAVQETASPAVADAPTIPALFLWVAALVATILLGIAGVLSVYFSRKETSLSADEFEIE